MRPGTTVRVTIENPAADMPQESGTFPAVVVEAHPDEGLCIVRVDAPESLWHSYELEAGIEGLTASEPDIERLKHAVHERECEDAAMAVLEEQKPKPKAKRGRRAGQKPPKRLKPGARLGKQANIQIPFELMDWIEEYRGGFTFPPSVTAVILQAIECLRDEKTREARQ